MALIYTFRGTLVLQGALHIGSGGGDAETDATVVRDSWGRPYIPGSSLRGAFRATVERLATTLLELDIPREMNDLEVLLRPQIENRDENEVQQILRKELRSLERLFGTTYWSASLVIPDLPLLSGAAEGREIRHGVGIDRDTGAARDTAKYDFEVLPRDHQFNFCMRCEMDQEYMDQTYQAQWKKVLAIGLRLLEQGELLLGGRLARGVGQVQLRDLRVYVRDTSNKADLLAALRSPDRTVHDGRLQSKSWIDDILSRM